MRRRCVGALLGVASLGWASLTVGAAASPVDELYAAVRRNDGSTITRLLQRGVDPNTPDASGQPPIVLAFREDSSRAAQALLDAPALDVEATNRAGETALMLAALRGRTDWMQRLLARGAHVDKAGWTPLHYAASAQDVAPLELLLGAHAIVDAPSPNHTTPLMMAARYGSEAIVDRLLAAGADPAAVNDLHLDAAGFATEGRRERLAARLAKLAAARGP